MAADVLTPDSVSASSGRGDVEAPRTADKSPLGPDRCLQCVGCAGDGLARPSRESRPRASLRPLLGAPTPLCRDLEPSTDRGGEGPVPANSSLRRPPDNDTVRGGDPSTSGTVLMLPIVAFGRLRTDDGVRLRPWPRAIVDRGEEQVRGQAHVLELCCNQQLDRHDWTPVNHPMAMVFGSGI